MTSHKGFTARIEFDDKGSIFAGRIFTIPSIIGFHGEVIREVRSAFERA